MRKLFFITAIVCYFIFPFAVFTQISNKPDPAKILDYNLIDKTNAEIYKIENSAQSKEEKKSAYSKQRNILLAELKKFHTKFIKNKKIWEQMDLNGYMDKFKNPNEIRLHISKYFRTPQSRRFIADIAILFKLHAAIGYCYEKENRPYNALSHYFAAFRYRSFAATEKLYTDPARLYYLANNTKEKEDALKYSKLVEEVKQKKTDVENSKRKISVHISRKALGLTNKLNYWQQLLIKQEQDYKIMKSKYDNAKQLQFLNYKKQKAKTDSNLIYAMANVVKELENRNKKRLRILSRSNYGNAVSNDYTENRNFVGYASLLEFAHRLNPENNLFNEKLSDEYRQSQKIEKAIEYTKLFISQEEKSEASKQDKEKIKKFHFRLGGLYTNVHKYLLASQEFENYVNLAKNMNDKKQVQKARYYLAQLHFSKTGNLNKSAKFFKLWYNEEEKQSQKLNLKNELTLFTKKFSVLKSLSDIMKKKRNSKLEFSYLLQALKQYENISLKMKLLNQEKTSAEKEMLSIKKELRNKSTQLTSGEYREAEIVLEQKKNEWKMARGYRRIMNIVKIKTRLAEILIKGRDYNAAIVIYQSLLKSGLASNSSRIKIKKLRLLLNASEKQKSLVK